MIRSTIAENSKIKAPYELITACLTRFGLRVKVVRRPISELAETADEASGYLLIAGGAVSPSFYFLRDRSVFSLRATSREAVATRITTGELLKEAKLNGNTSAPLLYFEPRPTLDDARMSPGSDLPPTPFRRLMGLLAPDTRDIGIVILFAVAVGILSLATPIAVQSLVNFVAFGGLTQPLIVIAILLFAFLAMAGIIRTFKSYIVEVLQRRIFVRVVGDLAYRLPRVRMDAFDDRSAPELVNRFFDVFTVQKASATFLLDGVGVLLQAMIGLVILAFYHPFLLAFDIVLIGAIFFILFVLGRGALKTAIKESKAKYAVAASLEEIALNPLTYKQAGGSQFAWERADALAVEYVKARRSHFQVVLRQIVGAVALQAIAATALLTLGGFLVIEGELTLGQLVASELIVSIVLASFAKLGKQLESIYDLLAGVDKLGQLIDLPMERDGGEDAPPAHAPGELRLIDVDFVYDEAPVFSGLSLTVHAGERVLILGDNGAGKSTLTELLSGTREPTGGRIELNGTDFRELSLDSIRRTVAVVKGLEIVEGTIAENVRLGREDISNDDVRSALGDVGLLETVRSMPSGMDTVLNNVGRPLSYGQARRLMVARAIAARPSIILLDDLLDDIDAVSRERVMKTIFDPKRPWTVIVTSHSHRSLPGVTRVIPLSTAQERAIPA